MTILPQYDEFGIYTTTEDIKNFVSSLFEVETLSENEVISKCMEHFGKNASYLIEKVLYGED
jgi:hypothetical protein